MAKQTENSEIFKLLEKCGTEDPDPKDVQALKRELVKVGPGFLKQVEEFSQVNMRKILEETQMSASARELIKFDIANKSNELGYQAAPMVEKMLIDVIMLAWLRYQKFEHAYSTKTAGGMSFQEAAFWEKRMTAAQGRYLKAVETLARVRKLTFTVQVNVAQSGSQQVNVAGDLVKGEAAKC